MQIDIAGFTIVLLGAIAVIAEASTDHATSQKVLVTVMIATIVPLLMLALQ